MVTATNAQGQSASGGSSDTPTPVAPVKTPNNLQGLTYAQLYAQALDPSLAQQQRVQASLGIDEMLNGVPKTPISYYDALPSSNDNTPPLIGKNGQSLNSVSNVSPDYVMTRNPKLPGDPDLANAALAKMGLTTVNPDIMHNQSNIDAGVITGPTSNPPIDTAPLDKFINQSQASPGFFQQVANTALGVGNGLLKTVGNVAGVGLATSENGPLAQTLFKGLGSTPGTDVVMKALGLDQGVYPTLNNLYGNTSSTADTGKGKSSTPYDAQIDNATNQLATFSQIMMANPQLSAQYKPMVDNLTQQIKDWNGLRDQWRANRGAIGQAAFGSDAQKEITDLGKESVQLHGTIKAFNDALVDGDPQEIIGALKTMGENEKLMEGIKRLGGDDAAAAILSVEHSGDLTPFLDKNGVVVPSKVRGVLKYAMEAAQNRDNEFNTALVQEGIDPNSDAGKAIAQQYRPDNFDFSAEQKRFNQNLNAGVDMMNQHAKAQAIQQAIISGDLDTKTGLARLGAMGKAGEEAIKQLTGLENTSGEKKPPSIKPGSADAFPAYSPPR